MQKRQVQWENWAYTIQETFEDAIDAKFVKIKDLQRITEYLKMIAGAEKGQIGNKELDEELELPLSPRINFEYER